MLCVVVVFIIVHSVIERLRQTERETVFPVVTASWWRYRARGHCLWISYCITSSQLVILFGVCGLPWFFSFQHQVIWNRYNVTFSFSYLGEMLQNVIFQQILEKVRRMRMGFLKPYRKIKLNNITSTKISNVYFIHHFLVQILHQDWKITQV